VFADALAKRGADLDSADSDGSFLKNYLFWNVWTNFKSIFRIFEFILY
jgi:hypothetical protein